MSKMMMALMRRLENDEPGQTGGPAERSADTAGLAGSSPDMGVGSADDDSSDVNWGGMAEELIAEDSGVEGDEQVVDAPEVNKPAESPAPAAPPAADAAAVVPPAEAPVPPTVSPPATPPLPEAPATPTPPVDYAAWRTQKESELESTLYAVNDEDAAALLTEPEKVLPKMAARLHMEVLENAMRAVQAMVPTMIEQVQRSSETNNRAKSLFTSINPDLADPKFEPAIMQLGQTFRKVNPTADAETAAKAIGALVRSALNIPAPQANVGGVAQTPPAMPAPAPFTPARGGGGGTVPAPSSNPFAQMAEEFLNEDM